MLRLAAAVLILSASRVRAQDPAPPQPQEQQELKQSADILQAATDADFLTAAGDGEPASPDSRLSRPRTLSLIYETLAAEEYHAAAESGLLQGPELDNASAKAKSLSSNPALFADPKTRKASASWTRLSTRIQSKKGGLAPAGRGAAPANKKMAALAKSLGDLNAQLNDPGASPAKRASLHAQVGKVYEKLAAAARLQGAVSVVDASVMDDDDSSGDHPQGKKSKAAAKPAAAPSSDKLRKLADKIRAMKNGALLVKTAAEPSAAQAAPVRANRVSRMTALRSLYRQLAIRDYRACLSPDLPWASKAKIISSLKNLRMAGERAAWKASRFSDDDSGRSIQACGCPAGAEPLGVDSYGLCYCADNRGADAPASLKLGASIEKKLSGLDPLAAQAADKLAGRETPKSKSRVSAEAQDRYQRAQAYERMAAAVTRPVFPATPMRDGKPDLGRIPSAGHLQKLAAALRSGLGPIRAARVLANGEHQSLLIRRSMALKRTYQTMAALDYRASLIAGLPADKVAQARASLTRIYNQRVRGRLRRKAGAKFADDEGDDGGDSGGEDNAGPAGDGDSASDDSAYAGAGDYSVGDSGGNDSSSAADSSGGDDSSAAADAAGGDDSSSMADAGGGDSGGDASSPAADSGGGDDSSAAADAASGDDSSSMADAGDGDSGGDASSPVADSGGGDDSSAAADAATGDDSSSMADAGGGDSGWDASSPVADAGEENSGSGDEYAGTSLTDTGTQDPDPNGGTDWGDLYASASGDDSGPAAADSGAADENSGATADASVPADGNSGAAAANAGSAAAASISLGDESSSSAAPIEPLDDSGGGPCADAGSRVQGFHGKKTKGIVQACMDAAKLAWNSVLNVIDWVKAPPGTRKCPDGTMYATDSCVDLGSGDRYYFCQSGATGCTKDQTGMQRPQDQTPPPQVHSKQSLKSALASAMKACPAKSRVLYGTKAGFVICSVQRKAARIAGLARKSRKGMSFHKLARLDRSANKVSGILLSKATSASRKAALFFQRAQLYQRMAAAIPANPKAFRKSVNAAPRPGPGTKAKAVSSAPKAKAAANAAADPSPAPAASADPVKQSIQDMEDMSKQMQGEVDRRRNQAGQ